jgi:hypothetical protein
MKYTFILTFALLLAPHGTLRADVRGLATTKLDVIYKTTEQGPLKLDLHYPAAPKAGTKYPLVLFTHGGGWAAGNKTIGDRGVRFPGVSALNAQGFCVASVDYRLCTKDGKITMRDCVIDSKDALRFLAKNAAQYTVDLLPTFCGLAGAKLPDGYQPDGISQVATLEGKATPTRSKPLFWRMEGAWPPKEDAPFHWVTYAVVDRQWKLLSNRDGSHRELYDIAADPLETKDIASDKPGVVKEIVARLEQWKSTLPEKPGGEVFSAERSK